MPRLILKPDPDRDLYVEWSTIVDGPTGIGTRAEWLRELGQEAGKRLVRADLSGTSAYDGFGAWNGDGLLYGQQGILPRNKLLALVELLLAEPNADPMVAGLLEPFEDDLEAQR